MFTNQKALSDITFIKETINNSKKHHIKLKNLFIIYGVMNILLLFMQFISMVFTASSNTLSILLPSISLIVYSITAVILIRISNKAKETTNIFFRLFIGGFLLISVLFPIILLLVRVFTIFSNTINIEVYANLNRMNEFLNVILFSISLFLVGQIREKKLLTGFSVVNIFLYLLLYSFGNSLIFGIPQVIGVEYSALYSGVLASIGYISLAVLLNRKGVNSSNEY